MNKMFSRLIFKLAISIVVEKDRKVSLSASGVIKKLSPSQTI